MNNKIDISYLNSSSKERHLLIDSIGFDVFLEPQKKVFIRYKIIENFDFHIDDSAEIIYLMSDSIPTEIKLESGEVIW
jgi:hypothetical protein